MKLMWQTKDGGPESRVWCYGLEIKSAFSVLLLHFGPGSREAYHSHAFNAVSWVLWGRLLEYLNGGVAPGPADSYRPSLRPILTRRETYHKVYSVGNSWVLSFRGQWAKTWCEWTSGLGATVLGHGRVRA